jgi:hypothetical protein
VGCWARTTWVRNNKKAKARRMCIGESFRAG